MFHYDWFHGSAYQEQREVAMRRCLIRHFPDASPEQLESDEEIRSFYSELDVRTLLYLRDGFSYEVKEIADVRSRSHLVFECEPVDDHYKVGCFIVTVPFDEIVRVEVYAVHPSQKPEDSPQITGFRSFADAPEHKFHEPKSTKPGR